MITKFPGKRYNFEILAEKDRRYSTFSIRAISKDTGKYSSINNLNTILSELGVDNDNPKCEDSFWVLTVKEADKFTEIIRQDLSSPSFTDYLESKLDEDRECGEWANSLEDNRDD
ncbi:MAG TPA: hypothetical protein VGA85_01435 [Dehalococcoidales bacterium]